MNKFKKPLSSLVAVALVAGAVGLYLTRDKAETYKVTAYFEKVIGLFPNSDVTILGVAVGKVSEVEPVGRRVRVEMNIKSEHKIPADAFAHIIPISVISDRYIQFEPVYESGPALEDGAVLDVEDTQIPAELDDVFKQLKKLLDAIEPGEEGEPGALGDLIVQLDDTLADREDELQGTLIHASDLTRTLARAQDDLSGLLVNLDALFRRLATRAGSLGTLNHNFALVMEALQESRFDLEDTIAALADMTIEVGDLVRDHRQGLGEDLALATRITSTVLKNRKSVEESLQWLPVVAIGLKNAHHAGQVDASDVRDNATAKFDCTDFDDFPAPIGDVLKEICEEAKPQAPAPAPQVTDAAPEPELLDCDKGVHKVRRQIRRIAKIGIPQDLKDDVIDPLRKQLRKLKKKCKLLGETIADPKQTLDKILEKLLKELGDIPELVNPIESLEDLTGNAAGAGGAVIEEDDDDDGFFGWMGGFLGFMGWSS
jgi:phospholipid/cholesterol/gamma-HCH transport system substrate-binding protein